MILLGEWSYGGNVNFVATSKHASGMVATTADMAAEAVRIYDIPLAKNLLSPALKSRTDAGNSLGQQCRKEHTVSHTDEN